MSPGRGERGGCRFDGCKCATPSDVQHHKPQTESCWCCRRLLAAHARIWCGCDHTCELALLTSTCAYMCHPLAHVTWVGRHPTLLCDPRCDLDIGTPWDYDLWRSENLYRWVDRREYVACLPASANPPIHIYCTAAVTS